MYKKSTGKPWDVAEGPNFAGDDLGALNGPLPTHSFQKVGRAMGGIFPAGRSPLKEERGREERGREEGDCPVLEERGVSGKEGATAGTRTSDNQISGLPVLELGECTCTKQTYC